MVLWERFPAQQSDGSNPSYGDNHPDPVQWHWLCSQQSIQAEIRPCLAGEAWCLGSQLGLSQPQLSNSELAVSTQACLPSSRDGLVSKERENRIWKIGWGKTCPVWATFCRPVWSDATAVSNDFQNCEGTGMIECVPVENTGKHCIWA